MSNPETKLEIISRILRKEKKKRDVIIPFGKYKGELISSVAISHKGYVWWLARHSQADDNLKEIAEEYV